MENSFGKFFSTKRKEAKLTQKELAKKLFVTESAVSKWEQDKAHPDITLLPKLAILLNVSEHELITASVDESKIKTEINAKRWTNLISAWQWFFYISYAITLLTCFIVNICTSNTLSWFWIVFSAILLSASFTTLPQFIKSYKLLLISLLELLSLIILLAVCSLYSNGNWFVLAITPIIVTYLIVFLPIFINIYNFHKIVKQNSSIICVTFSHIIIWLMLLIINSIVMGNFILFASILLLQSYICSIIILLILKFLKHNGLIKSGLITLVILSTVLITNIFLPQLLQKSFSTTYSNSFLPNFSIWYGDYISANIISIIIITTVITAVTLLLCGIFKKRK